MLQSNVIVKNAAKIIELIRSGLIGEVDSLLTPSKTTLCQLLAVVQENQSLRNGRLRMAIEKVVEAELLVIFFRTGKLAMFDEVQPCNDEEYIIAALSMAQELSRYCKERACEVRIFVFSSCLPLLFAVSMGCFLIVLFEYAEISAHYHLRKA